MASATLVEDKLSCLQINLHHAKAASDVLSRRFVWEKLSIALIQEPWVHQGRIKGLPTKSCKLIYSNEHEHPRAALLLKSNLSFIPLSQFISRDVVAVAVEVPTSGGSHEVVITSAYFPGDVDTIPPPELIRLISYCKRRGRQIIIGCDANAHHTLWGSTDTNVRGEYLFDFILSNNLEILNRGNKPTFMNVIRQEVLDLTLASTFISTKISRWHVSNEISMSDHRHIKFDIEATSYTCQEYRIPKLTNWELYRQHLKAEVDSSGCSISTTEEIDSATTQLQTAVLTSFEHSCPVKQKTCNRQVPWWNRELGLKRTEVRKLFNRAKLSGCWEEYKKALTEYNKDLRRSKRRTWRTFCDGIDQLPAATRLHKVLSKDHSNGIGSLQKEDGHYTESCEETVRLLLETHFPGSFIPDQGIIAPDPIEVVNHRVCNRSKSLAGRIFTPNKVRWAIGTFKPFKSAGGDGIFPALLQQGVEEILPPLLKILRASYALGYIPQCWRDVRVVFIPKAGKRASSLAKSFRPISLSSFLLKSMEKILDLHIRSEILTKSPLHAKQFAYQAGKSTETAIHTLVRDLEKALEAKEVALCAFADIQGAFDNTSFDAIKLAAVDKGVEASTVNWIDSMLRSRRITTTLGNCSVTITAAKGCPQGGVLSPLLWSIVIDDLLVKMTNSGFNVQGYADDIVVTIRGKHDQVISDLMQEALSRVHIWCSNKGLSINPSKTVIVPFTRRSKLTLTAPSLDNMELTFSDEVKYLGVILDKKITWNAQLSRVTDRAVGSLYTCRRFVGRTWGLQPKMMYWLYITVVRPMVTYAALAWWPKTNQRITEAKLQKIQRLACLGVTGAISTCPTAAMEALLNLPPLHLQVKKEAISSAIRLQREKQFKPGDLVGHLSILKQICFEQMTKISDIITPKLDFVRPFDVVLGDRQQWRSSKPSFKQGSMVWYTDGSKTVSGVGLGVYGPRCRISKALGSTPTVFQAEVLAIDECASTCINRAINGSTIYILSDSQAALKALKSFTIKSRIVWECLLTLKNLSRRNKIILMWVPGHEGHKGNEIADGLAKRGAETPFVGPEPFCGTSKCYLRATLNNWEKNQKSLYWERLQGLRQAKMFIDTSGVKTKELLLLRRTELKTITELFSGHCSLRYHLSKMGLAETSSCRFCQDAQETSEHLLCNCAALARRRILHLEHAFPPPKHVWNLNPRKVLDFFYSLDLVWE